MRLSLIVLLLLSTTNVWSDDMSYNRWYFGKKQGLNFNNIPPTFSAGSLSVHYEGTGVICDSKAGDLLLYSDGNTIWNRNHEVIINGFNPDYSSSTQSVIIVRQPDSLDLYHVFTTPNSGSGKASDVIIDLRLKSGLGDVVSINSFFTPTKVCEKVGAVRSTDGNSYWVVFRRSGPANVGFYAYKLSSNGLDLNPVVSNVGAAISSKGSDNNGALKFSPDGKRMACANCGADLELFDFNASTGVVSNARVLNLDYQHSAYGTEFSPSGRYIYVDKEAPFDAIFRFDLLAADVQASRMVVTNTDGSFGQMQLARDGKIYVSNYNMQSLSAISSCDSLVPVFDPAAVQLTDLCFIGLPTFPQECLARRVASVTTIEGPIFACQGSQVEYSIRSTLGTALNAELLFEDGSTRTVSGTGALIQFKRLIPNKQFYSIRAIVHSTDQGANPNYDTVLIQTSSYYDCCSNVVRNGNFNAIAAGGQCFTVEYETELDFRSSNSAPCPYTIDKPGQAACNSDAHFASLNWEGKTHSVPGDFLLYGEPSPNKAQRAWIQRVPVWNRRSYSFKAFVKNVEKVPRYDTTNWSLNFALVVTQQGVSDTVAALSHLNYKDGWQQLSGTYSSTADGDVELSVVVLCTSGKNSYGFGIDDISFGVLPSMQLKADSVIVVCPGYSTQIRVQASGRYTSHWEPSIDLSDAFALEPIVTPTQSRTYRLVAQDSNGCEKSLNIIVRLLPAHAAKLIVAKKDICLGDSVVLQLSTTYSDIIWSDGSKSSSLVVRTAGDYYASALTSAGCWVNSDTVHINSVQNPSIRVSFPDVSNVLAGQIIRLPLILHSSSQMLIGSTFTATIRCKAVILRPIGQNLPFSANGDWNVFEYSGTIGSSDTVALISFLTLVGLEKNSEVIIDSIRVLSPCNPSIEYAPGTLSVQACWIGMGVRLTNNASQTLQLFPNPVQESVHVEFDASNEYVESVEVINSLGQRELAIYPHELHFNSKIIDIDVSSLSNGVHLLILHSSVGNYTALFVKQN